MDDDSDSHQEETAEAQLSSRRRNTRKRKQVDYSEENVKVIPNTNAPSKQKRRRGRGRPTNTPSSEADEVGKEKSTKVEGEKKKRGQGRPSAGISRDRGSLHERTCPYCRRVFTSTLGKDYHVDHKVCRSDASKRQRGARKLESTTKPFDTLSAGSKFVTPFGVVQVVADNRATPTGKLPADARNAAKKYGSAKSKWEAKQRRAWGTHSVRNRARRRQLGELYERGESNKMSVFEVYFGGDPRELVIEQEAPPTPRPTCADPLCPEESYPDRMVECFLIPDERTVHIERGDSHEKEEDESQSSDTTRVTCKPNSASCRMKLFLRRRLLLEQYLDSIDQFVCADCGRQFASQPGYAYHTRGRTCVKKSETRGEQQRKIHNDIEERVDLFLERSQAAERNRRRLNRLAFYPPVWSSLEFRAADDVAVQEDDISDEEYESDVSELVNPNDVLADLRTQLMKERNRLHGAMYPSIFKYLGFYAPGKRPTKREPAVKKKRKRRRTAPAPKPLPQKPLPPIIDVRVLADEVDSGRYPSMKRYNGEHVDECTICREDGTLYCCDFCENAIHLACIREKHTVKHPEPEDDFLCHKCIQYILVMRTRAEKRRLQKQQAAQGLSRPDVAAGAGTSAISKPPVRESEYHKLAVRAQELNELVELLQDTTARLREGVRVKAINDARRALLH